MKKEDVETHYDRERLPAVNVKVDAWNWARHARKVATDNGASFAESVMFAERCQAWQEDDAAVGGMPEWLWEVACENGWETAQMDADTIWDDRTVRVESMGRCGGWAIVRGLPDLDDWDAVMVAKWARFAKWTRATADDVPYVMADLAYTNIWRPERDEKVEADRERREAEAELATARY